MRRTGSTLFFFVGGLLVAVQVMVAFFAGEPGYSDDLGRIFYFGAIAAALLAIGTWLSPADRWRELGLTILVGALVCVASFSVVLFLPDENGSLFRIEQLPPGALAPGFANLLVLLAIGLLLYFRGGTRYS